MLTLTMLRNWLEEFYPKAENYYVGTLESKMNKSIGVYQSKHLLPPVVAIGGKDCNSYQVKRVFILLHWDNNQKTTEEVSFDLYKKLEEIEESFMIDKIKIQYIELLNNEPISVGADNNGIYEMQMEVAFYYEK